MTQMKSQVSYRWFGVFTLVWKFPVVYGHLPCYLLPRDRNKKLEFTLSMERGKNKKNSTPSTINVEQRNDVMQLHRTKESCKHI